MLIGLGLIGLGAASLIGGAASATDILDIRVGHNDGLARIELILSGDVEARRAADIGAAPSFTLPGVDTAAIALAFGDAQLPVQAISVEPSAAGAVVIVAADRAVSPILYNDPAPGAYRVVIDLAYAPDAALAARRAGAQTRLAEAGWSNVGGPPARPQQQQAAAQIPATDSPPVQTAQNDMPSDTPGDDAAGMQTEAPAGTPNADAEPIRVAGAEGDDAMTADQPAENADTNADAPANTDVSAGAVEANAAPPQTNTGVIGPTNASLTPAPPPDVPFAEKAQMMLGADLSDIGCNGVRETLRENAWDMDALVGYGLCLAEDDRLAEADTVFQRLLTIEPLSYQAYVGRALIAEKTGDSAAAIEFYRSALGGDAPEMAAQRIQIALSALGG